MKAYLEKIKKNQDVIIDEFYFLSNQQNLADLLEIDYEVLTNILKEKTSKQRDEGRLNYIEFTIPKKSGKVRTILAPKKELKDIQRRLSKLFQVLYKDNPAAQGFLPNKSIITNARKHQYKKAVLNVDIKDFFPSITISMVRELLSKFSLPEEVIETLLRICCFNGYLPQGAPTSPILSNMVCAELDNHFMALAKKYKLTYTRYADDITFSTTADGFPNGFKNYLRNTLSKYGFQINFSKYRIQTRKVRQEVTGLTVNEFPNVQRKYIRHIKTQLYFWDKSSLEGVAKNYFGFEDDAVEFKQVRFITSLRGKIEYIGMVRGKDDKIYKRFKLKFDQLYTRYFPSSQETTIENN